MNTLIEMTADILFMALINTHCGMSPNLSVPEYTIPEIINAAQEYKVCRKEVANCVLKNKVYSCIRNYQLDWASE